MLSKLNPLAPKPAPMRRYAEGGEVDQLLAPAEMMAEEEMMDDGMMMEEEMAGPSPFMALEEILGPEKVNELYAAMEAFPVVEEVANMAVQTSDGEVSGIGTGTSDEVPARLSEGEFILPKEVVDVIGIETLEKLLEDVRNQAASMG